MRAFAQQTRYVACIIVAYFMVTYNSVHGGFSPVSGPYGGLAVAAGLANKLQAPSPVSPAVDPIIAPEVWTLPQTLNYALAQNLSLHQAKDQVVRARSIYHQRWADLLPDTVVSGQQSSFINRNLNTNRRFNSGVELNVTVPGNHPYAIKAAKAWQLAATKDQNAVMQAILADTANAFYSAMEAHLQVANARISLEEALQQIQLAKKGAHPGEDTTRAQTQMVQQQQRVTTAINQRAQTLQNLKRLLNLPAETQMTLADPDKLEPLVLIDPVMDGDEKALLLDLRQHHPTLLRLADEYQALLNLARQAKTSWLPNVTGRAYWGSNGLALDQQNYVRDAGVAVNMTVLENMGVAIPLRVQERMAEARQKWAEWQANQRQLETDLIQSRLDSQALLDNLQQTIKEKALAESNYTQTLARYTRGDIPFVTVTDAQDSLINARNNFVQILFGYNRAQVRQLRAIGHVSPQRLTQPATSPPISN
jgi:outer membrane protein TolC